AGIVLMQSTIFSDGNEMVVGLNGQAIAVGDQLTEAGRAQGRTVRVQEVTDLEAGSAMVADGELDALVSGPPAGLRVLVKEQLDQDLRGALDAIVQRQVLEAQLAASEDLDAETVLRTVAAAHVDPRSLQPPDPQREQRLVIALLIIALLYVSLVLYGSMVAQGVIEEKSSRVVELLLATVRPWQLLIGKVIGLGLVGLIQLSIIGSAGVLLGVATGALSFAGIAIGSLLWGLVWYVLGFFLYATVFAAAAALVSRQEDAQAVLMPIILVLVAAFVVGFGVLAQDPASAASTVLALLPPFTPLLMPGKMALGAAPAWQVLAAIALTLLAIAALAVLGGRIYRNAVLHMGTRVRLRDALRS
ncbi:MAG TPA: ABC transporter permease, partial [Micromonosporaceae bacterium]|nr:ABC transporter permease [Micromonosporaceae bacterium]